jgi:hypothetical protein
MTMAEMKGSRMKRKMVERSEDHERNADGINEAF